MLMNCSCIRRLSGSHLHLISSVWFVVSVLCVADCILGKKGFLKLSEHRPLSNWSVIKLTLHFCLSPYGIVPFPLRFICFIQTIIILWKETSDFHQILVLKQK